MKAITSFNITIAVIAFIIAIFGFGIWVSKERFTSPGTMVQLATSHVPTAEDYYYYKNIYPKVVRRDIIDMTGGDPGPIPAFAFG